MEYKFRHRHELYVHCRFKLLKWGRTALTFWK